MEEMPDRRGVDVSYETIRSWTVKLGSKIAASLQRRKLPPSSRSNLDEMVCKIGGERVFLFRAVDDEGDEPDLVVPKRRDTRAALELL
jgi:transposase-like protein